jgi:hypothetical protein
MKKLIIFIIILSSFRFVNGQNISLNEETKKYEWNFEVTSKLPTQNDVYDHVEEWLVSNYYNKSSSLKLSNREKGKLIYTAAFETKIFLSKGLISFNYTIKFNKNKVNFLLNNFAYTIMGQTKVAGIEMNFENNGLASKKKIIEETEIKIIENLKKLRL